MNKRKLVQHLAKRTNLTHAKTRQVLLALTGLVTETLANNEEVILTGLGTFGTRFRPERTTQMPHNGSTVKINAATVPTFRISETLRNRVACSVAHQAKPTTPAREKCLSLASPRKRA